MPSIILDKEVKQRALELCKDIDEKDIPYIALAIELDVPFITNDKKLYKGLKEKKFTNIILFEDFLTTFIQ